MEPQERTQLVTRLLEDATHMQTVLEQAIAAKEREAYTSRRVGILPMMSRLPPRCIPSKSSMKRGKRLHAH